MPLTMNVNEAKTHFSSLVSEVEKNKVDCHKNEMMISFKKGIAPVSCEGGEISLYEEHEDFKTYKIAHKDKTVKILF